MIFVVPESGNNPKVLAKELHIRIADQIGIAEDFFSFFPGFTALELEWRLQEVQNPEKIVLHISSPGGDVEEGLAIYNRLLELRAAGTTISVIVESHCYSIATLIAMAASPGELTARESSMWCVHKPMLPAMYYANADDLRRFAASLDACESAISAAYVSRTGKSIEEIQEQLRLDTIISAQDALAGGWIDACIPASEEATESTIARATALKPVAFVRPKAEQQPTENRMAENKKPGLWAKLKALLEEEDAEEQAPVEETPAPVADPSPEPEAPVVEEEEEQEDLAAALAQAQSENESLRAQLASVQADAERVTELEAQVVALKNTVPGGGQAQVAPPQAFVAPVAKATASPFDSIANNLKRK